jgi:hypothetical protein
MATQTRVNGGTTLGEFVGRDLKFVKLNLTSIETSYTAVESRLEIATRVLEKFCTVTVVGTPASSNVVFIVEGLPTGNVLDYTGASAAIATALATDTDKALLDSAFGSGSSAWTIYNGLSGTTFA